MALPPKFVSPDAYFEECILFFKKYDFLFKSSNTDVLVEDVFSKIDEECLETSDTYELGLQNKGQFEKAVLEEIKRFMPVFEEFTELDNDVKINAPLGFKKKHEIIQLSDEITRICDENDCNSLVDFGSGLGYLDQMIFGETNYNILGLECNNSHYIGAKTRQGKFYAESLESVKYLEHTINDQSSEIIQQYLQENFNYVDKFCISGLHACADLTVDAINLFLKMEEAKCLVIMPCCYHKMQASKGDGFKNFPLSDSLKRVYEKYDGYTFLKVPFLRLAAQPPNLLDRNLKHLVFNLMSRAVLQLYAHKHDFILRRKKRKAVKTKDLDNNFEMYIEDACSNGFFLYENKSKPKADKVEFDLEEIRNIWRGLTDAMFKKAAIFIMLQNCLQPIHENFVLYDRLVYLQEMGVKNCEFKKIFNHTISPRCLALVAVKNN